MESTITMNAMSSSLLARNVYCVCFTERDSLDILQGELAAARKKFFTGGRKTVKVGKSEVIKGFDGKLQGKLSRRTLYWKKSAAKVGSSGKVALEEAFDQKGGHVLVVRDFHNVIVSRVFYDRGQLWLKSEYYEPWDASNARVIFKPSDAADLIERFDWDADKKRYRSTMLSPLPYLGGTAEQSILNARFGEPQLIVSSAEGEFCYCPQKEAEARKRALAEINDGTIVLMPAWEVKDGALTSEEGEEDTNVTFTSLEEYARIEAPKEPETPAAPETKAEAPAVQSGPIEPEEFTPAPEEEDHMAAPVPTAAEAPQTEPEKAGFSHASPAQENAEQEQTKDPGDSPAKEDILAAARRAARELPHEEPSAGDVPSDAREKTEDELILEAARKAAGLEPAEAATPQENPPTEPGPAAQPQAEPERPAAEEPSSGSGAPAAAELKHADLGEPEAACEEPAAMTQAPAGGVGYRGSFQDGKISGRGRTEQQNGLTAYDGEYRDGKRDGFGSYYYKDGNLCYAGFWKDDRKNGLGVSFRDSDHALHIANWENGEPGGFVSLFDKDGNLRYGGRIEKGKKQGAGVSFNRADGTIFVGKWRDGEATGLGSAFDQDGNLLYYGGWQDGKRSGHGTEFDKNGGIVFDGEWKDGKYHNGILYQKLAQEGLPEEDGTGPTWDL